MGSRLFALLGVLTVVAVPARGAPRDLPERYAELLRADLRAAKTEILGESLHLSEPQASAFWPIYRAYEEELGTVSARRVALVREFVEKSGSLSDERAAVLADQWFSIQKERLAILERAHSRVRNALGAKVAARFVQVENTLNMLVDVALAEEAPLIE